MGIYRRPSYLFTAKVCSFSHDLFVVWSLSKPSVMAADWAPKSTDRQSDCSVPCFTHRPKNNDWQTKHCYSNCCTTAQVYGRLTYICKDEGLAMSTTSNNFYCIKCPELYMAGHHGVSVHDVSVKGLARLGRTKSLRYVLLEQLTVSL